MSNTDQPHCPDLEKGQIIPAFTLPGADGMPHSPWDYKQRDHLLLLFLHSSITSETCALLRIYAQHYADFRAEQCAILAITPDPVFINLQTQEKLRLPFPLVSDVQGKTISRYTQWNADTHTLIPSVILANRYNALYEQQSSEDITQLPELQDTLASLNYLNLLCTP
ncbi:redoxin domain-containing protein [Dictyobacter arantiisoli]|uniref:Alkyl hydroperoxide reductase subunit C/ Thiol specific antioxidant domain-containing protein n=1 Tax=Dictyobacter arantiisoli TaxID=2014874 RepID=A0A5A5TCF9_9CHLR|nr:redoxin domain-containing protein [Dictyobacter arantiisoli]GCF09201.1 hypothetical protein KDI_27650 [Dictyobacter arantiisoli]